MITIRASSLSSYCDCPRRTVARTQRAIVQAAGYTLRTTPTSIAAPVGTGVHAGAARLLIDKMHGLAIDQHDALDAAVEAFRGALSESEVLTDSTTPNNNTAEQQIARMLHAVAVGLVPFVDPVMVEERLVAQYADDIAVSGQGDNLCRVALPTNSAGLRDFKTGVRQGAHRPQFGTYALLYRSHDIDVSQAVTDFVQRVPLSKPQPLVVSTVHDVAGCETAARRVLDHFTEGLRLFTEGDEDRDFVPGDPWAFPANPSSQMCSEKYCAAFGTEFCKEHKETK